MAETFFSLNDTERARILGMGRRKLGREPHILEKDIWVVGALAALYSSQFANILTFKGCTSLVKGYGVMERFSEDADISCDLRYILRDDAMVKNIPPDGIPSSTSKAEKWAERAQHRLLPWLEASIKPMIQETLDAQGMRASIVVERRDSNDCIFVNYEPLHRGTGYVEPSVKLEFGALYTSEPFDKLPVTCDLASIFPELVFPQTSARVLKMERTFWEKATSVHVFCQQDRPLKGRSRHWFDVARLADLPRIQTAMQDTSWLNQVVRHKEMFFRMKDRDRNWVNYRDCMSGRIRLVPKNEGARKALREDYAAMAADGVLIGPNPLKFPVLLEKCAALQDEINARFS